MATAYITDEMDAQMSALGIGSQTDGQVELLLIREGEVETGTT